MSKGTKIEWADHSWNPWWGCVKVSDGCRECYAETFAKRVGQPVWGPAATTPRRFFADKHWAEPLRWNADAEKAGARPTVFCASMADVFEDHPEVRPHRERLYSLILQTPWLDWLLLTKRPENIMRMAPDLWQGGFPANVWMGTSTEDQRTADERIPHLLAVPAVVRWLSCEPLLGPINLSAVRPNDFQRYDVRRGAVYGWNDSSVQHGHPRIDWVITGGESGPRHRPMDLEWARSLRNQCVAAGVSFFFKQHGGRTPKAGGRELDGRTWDQFPEVRP